MLLVLLPLPDEEPVAEMALRVAEALMGGFAAAVAVEGELVEALRELITGEVVAHAHRLRPRSVLLHLLDGFPRARGGGGGIRIIFNYLSINLLWHFCWHFLSSCRHERGLCGS